MSNTNETNNKNFKRKFKIVKAIIISIIIIATISLTGIGFAKYMTSLKGSSEVQIAKWNFKVTAGSSENLTIDLAKTRYENDTTEVDKTKVAPGTKGEIVFNIDGNDSQVSLEYDINMSLTQIPENLIFYTDEQMTNAVYKDNGEMHLNGYFGVDNENKKETKILYWQWKLETGTTQEEIENNDVLDSKWMDKDISLGINAVGRQVADESSTTKCEVTFNLNGGKLASYGDSKQITKQVNYGENYGELPVPTREGYRFAGWGSITNLADKKYWIQGAISITGNISFDKTRIILNKNFNVLPNTKYKVYVDNNKAIVIRIIDFYDNNKFISSIENNSGPYEGLYSREFTTSQDTKYLNISLMYSGGKENITIDAAEESNINVIRYIDNTTPINKNHMLTAIWEKI